MRIPAHILILLLFAVGACNPEPTAMPKTWVLDTAASEVTIFAIKSEAIGETFTLQLTGGQVSDAGDVQIELSLDSIETGIAIRNSRMREHLFQIEKWPLVRITAKIDMQSIGTLEQGVQNDISSDITVDMHGISNDYTAFLSVISQSENRVWVQSTRPIAVSADDYELVAGLQQLQQLAHLSAITPVVAVSFSLVFQPV